MEESVYSPVYRISNEERIRMRSDSISSNSKTIQSKGNKQGHSKVVRSFLDSTTLHGLGRIFTARTKVQRLFWFGLVVSGLIYVTYATIDSINKYYSYPISTIVRMIFEEESTFPAVTICNVNKYMKKRALQKYPKLVSYYQRTGATKRDVNISSEQMETIFDDIGHPLESSLRSCYWASNRCSPKNFTKTVTENFGLCYTFNSGEPGHPLLSVPSSGMYFGLSLSLDLNQDEYLVSSSAGYYIYLHNQNEPLLVNSLSLSASPGQSTLIGVQKTKIENLRLPYRTACQELEIPGYKKYSKAACISNCFYNHIFKSCGCKKEGYVGPARMCSFYERVTCVVTAQKYFRLHVAKTCVCPEPCKSLIFKGSISQMMWPSDAYTHKYLKKVRNPNMTDEQYERFIRRNLVNIKVFFTSMNYQLIKQEPAYSSIDLFGSVGGLVGLFLGGSLLTVFEILELCCDLCCVRRKKQNRNILV